MPNVYLDPYIFACPSTTDGGDSFDDFVQGLLKLKSVKEYTCLNTFILAETYSILSLTGKYPLWDDISASLKHFNINYIQPHDVISVVNACLEKTNTIQDHLQLIDYLSEDTVIKEMPVSRENEFNNAFKNLLNFMALNNCINKEGQEYHLLLSRNYPHEKTNIQTNILMVDFNPPKPFYQVMLNYEFKSYSNFGNLLTKLPTIYVWSKSKNKNQYKTALKLHIENFNVSNNISDLENISYEFHEDFIKNLADHHFDKNHQKIEMLLKSLTETALNISLSETHALREGISGNSDQIVQKGFGAWRKDIDYEYHLHYWKKGKEIIITNLVHHNNFRISNI